MIVFKNKFDVEGKYWFEEIFVNGEDLVERFKDSEVVVNRSFFLVFIRKFFVLKELFYFRYDRWFGINLIDIILNYF